MSVCALDDNEVRYRISQIKELLPLPKSLKRMIDIIHSEVDTPGELESIISYEPLLVAKILMAANSSYYGHRKKIMTLSKSIAVIGSDQVKSICICTLLMSLLSNGCLLSGSQREMLWKHAFACSRIAVEMTRMRPWMNSDEAAVLGLLHDLGWIVMASHFNEQFASIFETAARRNIPPWYVERRYGLDHGLLGRYLARRWALPDEFAVVIEFHHNPERSASFKTEVGMIYLANVLSHSREYPDLLGEEITLSLCRDLYISEEEWEECQERSEKIWPEIDQLWNLLGENPE